MRATGGGARRSVLWEIEILQVSDKVFGEILCLDVRRF